MRMIQRGDGLGFRAKRSLNSAEEIFDGNDAVEPRVARLPHLPHAAGAEGGHNLVRAEASAYGN